MNKANIKSVYYYFARAERDYNITPKLLDKFRKQWHQFQLEQLFYYVYTIIPSK